MFLIFVGSFCVCCRLQWGFTSHRAYSDSEALVVTRLCRQYQAVSSTHTHTHTHMHTHTHVYTHAHTCIHTRTHTHMYTHWTLQIDGSNSHSLPAASFPRLQTHSITSLKELKPLFDALLHQNRSVASNHHHHHHHHSSKSSLLQHLSSASAAGLVSSAQSEARLAAVDNLLLCDFIEPLS